MKNLVLFLFSTLFLFSCGGNLETITVNEDDGTITSYTRNKENFAKEGLLTRTAADGTLLEEAQYSNDTLHGFRKLYYLNGALQTEETHVDGAFQGTFKTYYENGQVKLQGEYINNSMEGVWKGYYDGGELKEEVFFKNNNENGPFTEYYQNGKLKAKGNYLEGDNEDGLLELFDKNGELVKKMNCVKRICRTIWTKEGGDVEPAEE